jgi:hypothetical protein
VELGASNYWVRASRADPDFGDDGLDRNSTEPLQFNVDATVRSAKPPWHRYVGTRLLLVFRIHYSRQSGAYLALGWGRAHLRFKQLGFCGVAQRS